MKIQDKKTEIKIVKKTVFTFKTRPEIAPKDLQKATYFGAVNETPDVGDAFNRIVMTAKLEALDSKGNPFVLTKTYNLLGRGAAAFVEDYNAWSGTGLAEDDFFGNFDGEKDKGKSLVVEVGHRKIGNEWEAFIKSFHPAGYTGEPSEAELKVTAEVATVA